MLSKLHMNLVSLAYASSESLLGGFTFLRQAMFDDYMIHLS